MDFRGRLTLHVEVVAQVLQPERRASRTSNTFNFTFGVAENLDGSGRAALVGGTGPEAPELRRVLPATREEAYRIMERYRGDAAQLAEDQEAAKKGSYQGPAEV